MTDTTALNDELRPEYDETLLKNGIRGKYVGNMLLVQSLSVSHQMLPPLSLTKKL